MGAASVCEGLLITAATTSPAGQTVTESGYVLSTILWGFKGHVFLGLLRHTW